MFSNRRYVFAPFAIAAAFALTACPDRRDTAMTDDTALARDLELAGRDTLAEPQLQDVPDQPTAQQPSPAAPRTTTPPRQQPAPQPTTQPRTQPRTPAGNVETRTPAGTERATATIAAGTSITFNSNERVCTNTHSAGDRFTAVVAQPVMGSNGAMIPAGARAVVQVTSVQRSRSAGEAIQMGFVVQNVTYDGRTYPIDGTITDMQVERVRTATQRDDATKVIGGAVAGAVIGQILGRDTRSTVIGAATGAAAGTAVAMSTADHEGCLPQGGRIVVRLNSPATIQA
jgi:hypothetical protein